MSAASETIHRYRAEDLHAFVRGVLERLDVPRDDAVLAADALIAADVTGVDSHGVARFAGHPSYVPGLRSRRVNPIARPRIAAEAAGTALYDGDGGMGVVVASRAMEVAIDKAGSAGVGIVAVRNSRHLGIAAHYARMALPYGMIGLAMTNAFPQVVPPGGTTAMLGTNPISLAAPAGPGGPFVLDMATSIGTAGKAEIAQRAGKAMPDGWLVDRAGLPTTDPAALLGGGGALLPLGSFAELGSHKGFGLALAVDVLCGVLSGQGYSAILDGASGSAGHFLAAIRIDAFVPLAAFETMLAAMSDALRSAPRVPGVDRIYIHGEKEAETEQERRRLGIPLHAQVVAGLRPLADEFQVPFPTEVA